MGQAEKVLGVVFQDLFHQGGLLGLDKVVVDLGYLVAGNIVLPGKIEEALLHRDQAAVGQETPVAAPGVVEEIQLFVLKAVIEAVGNGPPLNVGDVKLLAVVGDHHLKGGKFRQEGGEQSPFLPVVAGQELLQGKVALPPVKDAH